MSLCHVKSVHEKTIFQQTPALSHYSQGTEKSFSKLKKQTDILRFFNWSDWLISISHQGEQTWLCVFNLTKHLNFEIPTEGDLISKDKDAWILLMTQTQNEKLLKK